MLRSVRATTEMAWAAVFVLAVVLAGVVADKTKASSPETDNSISTRRHCDTDLCLTPECVHTASRVLASMNRNADPCESFYSFACGEFVRTTKIPDDATTVHSFSLLEDEVNDKLCTILEEPISDADTRPVRLAKDLYAACLNTTLIEERGLTPIKNILQVLGGWPVLEGEAWNSTDFDWKQTIYKQRSLGLEFKDIMWVHIAPDDKNTTRYILSVQQASLGLDREYLLRGLEEKRVSAYYQYQRDIAIILGADPETASRDMAEAIKFETALANISMSQEESRINSLLYNPMTITEMQAKYPSIPWLEFFNNLLPQESQVNDSETVNVVHLRFLSELEKILTTTDNRVQANYLLWRVVESIAAMSPGAIKEARLKYEHVKTGMETEPPRRWTCADKTYNNLDVAVSSMYIKRFFNREAKQTVQRMVNDIKTVFREMVIQVDWMDENTKKRAVAKAKSIEAHIGYPDELLDDAKVDDYHKNLQISRELFLESMLEVKRFNTDLELSGLHQPFNKSDWRIHSGAAQVNAFYDNSENSIELAAGILQGVFFSPNRPMYMNFGAIGSTIGHEITHGFDDDGRQFDKKGNLVDWWESETVATFLEKAQCFIHQYGNYTEPMTGLKVNGINTQGENIADNGGVKEAYLAYVRWSQQQNKAEPRLPGLEWLTPQQMFWLAEAQQWCSKTRPERMHEDITTGSHSPMQFRVDGTYSNVEHFARDFGCAVGSNMNPEIKCKIW